MQKSTKNRLLTLGIVTLIILNGLAIYMHWNTHRTSFPIHQEMEQNRGGEHSETDSFLHHELVLSEAQQNQLEKLRADHFKHNRKYQAELHKLREHVTIESIRETPNLVRIRQLSDSLGNILAELEYARFSHFISIRSLCTPEQLEKFEHLLNDALHQAAPHEQETENESHEHDHK